MAVLRYDGPWDVRPLWGVNFPKGQTVVVDDPDLVAKARNLEGFVVVDEDEPETEPFEASNPDPDDYPAVEEDELEAEPEPLLVPEVGSGTIPENWRDLHHKTRMKLARELSGMEDIQTAEAADAVIEALLKAE